MSLSVGFDPQTAALLTAIGLTDDDGALNASWFDDPIAAAGRVLSNPSQRAALFRLLDAVLPAGEATPGWHPLLNHEDGNVYLTVDNDVIGVAAALFRVPAQIDMAIRVSVRLPLVDVSGDLRAIAGTAEGPLQVGIDLSFADADVPLTGISAAVSVDVERGGAAQVSIGGLDLGSGPVDLKLDSRNLGSDLVSALRLLLKSAVEALAPGDDQIGRLSDHLFELLGVGSDTIPPLPIEDLIDDPAAALAWLTDIVDNPDTLTAWATNLAGLIGDDLPVTGDATALQPLHAPLLSTGPVRLELVVSLTEGNQDLDIGLAVSLDAGPADLSAEVVALRIPVTPAVPGAPARMTQVIPSAAVVLVAPGTGRLVPNAPTLQVGTVRAGFRLAGFVGSGAQVQPWLALTEVIVDDTEHGTVDLTDADAVTDLVTDTVVGLLEQAFGDSPAANALLALLGLADPTGDANTPHRLDPLALGRGPTAALAGLHRAILADPAHPWSHQLAELAAVVGLTGAVSGDGTIDEPWRVPIETLGAVTLALAAWNDRTGAPDDEQRLRLGLLADATLGDVKTRLLLEVLAIDLPVTGQGTVRLVGRQQVRISYRPTAALDSISALRLDADSVVGTASWRPGEALSWQLRITGLTVDADGQAYGPLTWTLPGLSPDLGLGPAATGLVRSLLADGLRSWGGESAYALGALLGLHRNLPELPPDWPLLDAPGGLPALLADPGAALRTYIGRLVIELSDQGQPYVLDLLQVIGGLLPAGGGPAEFSVLGAGRYENPWAVPLPTGDAVAADLLAWLEPAGPPAAWIGALAVAAGGVGLPAEPDPDPDADPNDPPPAPDPDGLDPLGQAGRGLAGFLTQAGTFHPQLADLLAGRDQTTLGSAFSALQAWLTGGDGLVPLAAQLPTGPTWQQGTIVTVPHARLPRDPLVIAQIAARLASASHQPVVLVAPPFADHTVWTELLTAVAPARPAGAHFDLRALPDPAEVDPSAVGVVTRFYTADLTADAALSEVDQLERVVRRVRALTGGGPVQIVGHSTAGVTARRLAAAHADLVGGLITLGSPHAGSPLTPLTDPTLAAAVQVAAAVAGPITDTALGATVAQLGALLDGTAGPGVRPSWFAGVPGGLVDTVPGLAIGSRLSGDILGLLAGATVTALSAGDTPTHLALGVRTALATPTAADGEVSLHAAARVDLTRLRLTTPPSPGPQPNPQTPAAEPTRPATAVTVTADVARAGRWLVGDGLLAAAPGPARVRRLAAGVTVTPGPASATGTVAAAGWLRLYEAGLAGLPSVPRLELGDPDLRLALDAVLAELAAAGPDSAGRAALALLRGAGLVLDTSAGVRTSITGLADLAQVPLRTLVDRRAALVQAVRELIDQPGPAPISIPLGDLPMSISLDDAARQLTVRTNGDLELAGPFAARLTFGIDTTSFAVQLSGALVAGPFTLSRAAGGTITVAVPPWLPELTLRPYDPTALATRLTAALPELTLSAAVTALLRGLAGAGVSIAPVNALVRDPVGWLRRGEALGTEVAGKFQLDGDKVNALLQTIAETLSLDAAAGLSLPGGFVLSGAGRDPARLSLAGTFGVVGTATLALQLRVDLHPDGRVTPTGTATVAVSLPGDWGAVEIAFSLDATGLGLVVTPAANAGPIRLLPSVDGLGAVIGGVTALVPKVLQEVVVALRADGHTHDILAVALRIATALEIYAEDAAGFTEPTRAARLRTMLDPDWLAVQVASPAAVMDLITSLFTPTPVLTLPTGHEITRVGNRLRWAMPLFAGAELAVELGWSGAGVPQVALTLTGLDTGPISLSEARLGYLDGLTGRLRLKVDVGGDLAFFAPELELDVTETRLAVRVLPLGDAAANDCAIVVLPDPELALTADGGLALASSWLLPLIARFVLPEVDAVLGNRIWRDGPSPRVILEGAGILDPNSPQAQLLAPLPPLPAAALGALAAATDGSGVQLTDDLRVSAVSEGDRMGLRLIGEIDIPGDDLSFTVRFGAADWLTDPAAGITVWVLEKHLAADPPVEFDPRLSVIGLGGLLHGSGAKSLIGGADADDGPIQLDGAGALIFFEASFIDQGQVSLAVNHLGGAVELVGAAIHLAADDGDSFVAKLLPKELAAGFDLALAVRDGVVEIHGGSGESDSGIELTFPLDLDLFGVLFLRELFLRAAVTSGRTDVVAAISGNGALGPLAVNVVRVGLRTLIDGSGAQLAFKPPDGFGLSLDASVVRAGGFLLVDADRGRYVGALEISVLKKFSLTAIGIVTTKRPDGSPGFSLLLLITVTLPVPIPLGYGFFFAGAGGLLGLNRGMDVDRIRAGLRAGTADSILFPTDIIRRIDVIVRDLEEAFPPADGHFLIAPMAFIQWMNPALVTLKVGLVIEIAPQPKIALLGVLRLALPTPDQAVLDLKVAFLGAIDIGAGLLSFDASIYDSSIGYGDFKLSLEGDIAIRVSWGSSADLVASIGGFHPSYTPAAHLKLPAMRRITLSLLKDNPRLTLRLYFAVTSNTIQFGAQLEFFVGVSGFSISGDMGFDVLIQIAPFLIDAHLWAKLAVRAGSADICSISLDLQLRGPTPWIARGKASFSILFFRVSVEVEATFGEEHATSLPSQSVLAKVLDALRDPLAWVAELSASASASVTLLPPPAGSLVVDAAGVLTVRQNLIPLATDIAMVGAAAVADVRRVSVGGVHFGTGAARVTAELDDVMAPFAPSTFAGAPTSDSDRLRAPAFEQRPNGVRVRSGLGLSADFVLPHGLSYERIVLDDPDAPPPAATPAVPKIDIGALVAGGAVGASGGARQRRLDAEKGAVRSAVQTEPRFAVTTIDVLQPLDDGGDPVSPTQDGWPVGTLLIRTDADRRRSTLAEAGRRVQIVPEVQVAP